MNKKGFTLIELLATILILGLITTISIITISSLYENSKKKTEEALKKQLEGYVYDYISLNNDKDFNYDNTYYKCSDEGTIRCLSVKLYKSTSYNFNTVLSTIAGTKITNPNNELECTTANLNVYKDSDYVYCFTLDNIDCLSNTETINTCKGKYFSDIDHEQDIFGE